MSKTNLPGFTAHVALYNTSNSYRIRQGTLTQGHPTSLHPKLVLSKLPDVCWLEWHCEDTPSGGTWCNVEQVCVPRQE